MVTERISQTMQKVQLKNAVDNMARTLQGTAECAFGDFMSKSMSAGAKNDVSGVSSKSAEKSVQDVLSGGQDIAKQPAKLENVVKESSAADTEDIKDGLDTVMQEVKEAVKSELKLTDEELEAMLAQCGMTLADLLIPQNLAAFVAENIADGDVMKLLTDSSASEVFAKLTAKLNTIMTDNAKQFGISKEELTGILTEEFTLSETVKEPVPENEPEQAADVRPEQSVTAQPTADKEEVLEQPEKLTENKTRTYVDTEKNAAADKTELNTADTEKAVSLEEKVVFQSEKKPTSDGSEGKGENLSGQFVETLIQSVDKQLAAENVFEGYSVNAEDVVRQIVDAIKVSVTEHTTSMELQLSPENLGKVNLVVASKEGVITAQLTAQNEAVKTVIENQLVALKENFNAQGLKIEAIEVTIASHGFEMGKNFEGSESSGNEQSERGHARSFTLEEIDARIAEGSDFSEEEQLAAEMMRATGRSVDYMA